MQRTSGILLHPTALPGPFGVGDLGDEAFAFVDFLARAGQGVWQVLPLGPTGYGHSPYNALSAFAGNPALIDLRQLVACGDLDQARLAKAMMTESPLDFSQGHQLKEELLTLAGRTFFTSADKGRRDAFARYCDESAWWLDDYSLFMALRLEFNGRHWTDWPAGLRRRETEVLQQWRERLDGACNLHRYRQFVFAGQWQALKTYANGRGIRLFGDIPIFVAGDSADVWANQHLFQLDRDGRPTAVAGVPPDYFSATGQRWGNPLYRWDLLVEEDFAWWQRRFDAQLQTTDMVRIDHFRGFQACWSIPADEPTAVKGHWEEVPGRALFEKLRTTRGSLPIIAEDLGIITPDVEALREEFGFPGMKILQFAFDSGPDNPYLPQNHIPGCVVYTGTHDNDTTLGWWRKLSVAQKHRVREVLGKKLLDMPRDFVELAMASVAELCVIPLQDVLGLGSEARFNTPGQAAGNWSWRMASNEPIDRHAESLYTLATEHRRLSQSRDLKIF